MALKDPKKVHLLKKISQTPLQDLFIFLSFIVLENLISFILIWFQIGFNAGNGTQSYEYKPYSQNMVLRDLTGRGWANGFPGRHIFRIDERILIGTCNKDIGEF